MEFKYGLEDKPPLGESLLMGLQWCALLVPFMIILGKIAGAVHFTSPAGITVYLQKTAFIMAVFLFIEVLWGHRLPLVIGPSSVLLIGIISSSAFDMDTIYTAIICGGFVLALTGITGVFGYLQRLFTPRVVAVVLLLIAFTLTPTIMRLVTDPQEITPQAGMVYALTLTAATLILHRLLTGVWKSILILISMFAGSVVYFIIFPGSLDMNPSVSLRFFSTFFQDMTGGLSFDIGLLISFFICFVALSINDLGSMQSINALVKSPDIDKRVNRGIFFTGLANMASGIFGVIGQVNYSVSVGVVTATGCLSRFTLVTAAVVLLIISFSPMIIGFLGIVPSVVIGSIMLYTLCAQVSAGLTVAFEALGQFNFDDGMIIGMPILIATVIAFTPADFFHNFPRIMQPIVGNGFVIGVIILLFLEHGIFRKR
ncbi:MAG TPA: solute carrier family 23 protein [Syntrophales bacterium]|nr:solute carrier family 23 protein [Syntrophales bacterium]